MLKKKVWSIAMGVCWLLTLHANSPLQVAQSVLDRLYAANGNYTFKKPKIVLSTENKKVAAFSPWKNTITLDQKMYDICRGFGRDSLAALAYIIGHELVHAYQTQIKGQQDTPAWRSARLPAAKWCKLPNNCATCSNPART